MSKILITGASGLLGTEFCRQLKAAGHEVVAVDNHSRSSTIPPCDEWHKMDLAIKESFAGFNTLPHDFDYIYHYGAINGTTNFYKMPNKVLENNFIGDINVFNFAAKCANLKRLVYASSSEIVADDPTLPVPENTDVVIKDIHNARWSYRLAKITSENFLANSDLPYVMLRYFNVYGENSKPGHFLGDQINKIKNGIFSVIGSHETRSFCHVSDAIRASIFVAENVNRELVNIGNDREISIGSAVRVIANELGYPDAIFEELPSMAGSVANRCPDLTKLRSIMPDYDPMSFEEGIRQILS
jgi:UDP-glucose 4-epimerase/UDP-glucuronate decarboxylase